ncbi:MAG: hypothetical protein AVDCRST_MAG79-2520, partial [uncultured Thermoleophilia bacterium]
MAGAAELSSDPAAAGRTLRLVTDNQRNIAIVVGAALALTLFTGVLGPVAGLLFTILQILFLVALAWLAYRFWRENRSTIDTMPNDRRLMLYGAAAVLALVVVTSRFWVIDAFSALI